MAISTKLNKVLFKLCNLYFPFNSLSPERLQEIVNHIRIIELQQDEILQIRNNRNHDYLYLLEGAIDVMCQGSIQTLSDPSETQRSPVEFSPQKQNCSLIAKSDSIICHARRDILDSVIAWDYIGRESRHALKYIDIVRNTLVFRSLPIEYIGSAFTRMQRKSFTRGETIQSDQCAAYCLILAGKVEVQRFNTQTQRNDRITVLSIGDTFGHAALVAGKPINETLVMLENSEILLLDKDDYQELINRPLVRTVQPQVAKTMLDNGYQLLDVRFPEEYSENRIPGAKLVPLDELTNRIKELNPKQPYIIYCHSGPRSAIAALILSQRKFEALSLDGGIRDWPHEIEYASAKPNMVSMTRKIH
ncbi:MAG: cyclic nucleotide-binding domain-containing protein [Gammaproteobacteria bacterium]|nr:MAG: cyclic nucleotide-binding domain-containing protein [Gammaproteobacteria bacterium]